MNISVEGQHDVIYYAPSMGNKLSCIILCDLKKQTLSMGHEASDYTNVNN